jgi:hypothetical protein
MRNNPEVSKVGIKEGWWHYCHIPDIVILKMKQEDGVDVYDRNDFKAVGKLIESKYPYLKFTDGKHAFKD